MPKEQAVQVPWWKLTSHCFTFDEWLRLWKTDLPLRLRLALLEEMHHAIAGDDRVPQIRFLVDLFGDIQYMNGPNSQFSSFTFDVARKAAELLVKLALGEVQTGYSFAKEPQLFPDVLGVLKEHGHFFDNKEKQLHHKIKEGLKRLYNSAHKPHGEVLFQETEDSKRVINANLPLLIECLCAYDLFDIIEDARDSTLKLLEQVVDKYNSRLMTVERMAYKDENDRGREAARQLLYLRAKRAYLKKNPQE